MFPQFKLTFVLLLYMRLHLESHAVSDICSTCDCQWSQTYIYCLSRNLNSVPQPIPTSVEFLNLGFNKIKEIKADTFRNLSNLTTLRLHYNDINNIEVGSFQDLSSLSILYLHGNDLKEIKAETFRNLTSLTALDLSQNDIKEIKADTFRDLYSLTSLNLGENNLTEISEKIFENLSTLEKLYLNGNDIKDFKPGTFQSLSNLTHLYLADNNITDIKAETFRSLTNLRSLYLGNNDIKEIKAESFQNLSTLETLYLDYNNITEIKADSFPNISSLTKLYLQANKINDIEVGAFHKISSLGILDLHENYIKEIKPETFRNLASLTRLYLNKNKIKKIDERTFIGLTSVQYLYLTDNNITDIKAETFKSLSKLTTLYLHKNNIHDIEVGAFHHLSSLTTLYLAENKITDLKPETFKNLSKLTTLDLHENYIKEIKQKPFKNLPSLRSLYLNENKIKKIEEGAFDGLNNVKYLYLADNNITDIKAETFKSLSKLTILYLSKNHIKEIKAESFQNLPTLEKLYLQENKIHDIEVGAFHKLSSLGTLYLNENNIMKIEEGVFDGLNNVKYLYLNENKIKKIEEGAFDGLNNVKYLYLQENKIHDIEVGAFHHLSSLTTLDLHENYIKEIKEETFRNLASLTNLNLAGNSIKEIKAGIFRNLFHLSSLDLRNNQIKNYEDGTFLFLPSITNIDLRNNTHIMCGCHLPALVNYTKRIEKRDVNIQGECMTISETNRLIIMPILEYSQCKNYSLFQRNLQCQSCSEKMCKDSDVATCTGDEPMCHLKFSMNGVALKIEKSCSTYKKCLDGLRNNTFTCNKWTSGTSCDACCTGNICNKKDFIGWSNSFLFHVIFNSKSNRSTEYIGRAENMSRAMEHALSNLTGTFEVEYCGVKEGSEVFTVTCTVPQTIAKDQIFKQIFKTLNTSQTLLDFGIQQRNMKLIDEILCKENTTTNSVGTSYWPMTKIGDNATIPCDANVATRYCSARPADVASPKCPPFTGVWQEPDMSQCYNTQAVTQQLKNITNEVIDKENVAAVSTILRDISEKSVYFKEENLNLAVDIHEKMVPLISNVPVDITVNNILQSINNIINTPEEVLVKAEQSKKSGNRMLKMIEEIVHKIPMTEQQLSIVYSNLGIGVMKVNVNTFKGAFYGFSFGNNETTAKMMIHNTDSDPRTEDSVDSISLPKNLLRHVKEDQSAVSRISFILMQDKLYRVIRNSGPEETSEINSNIIAANIPNTSITNLDKPIKISFHLKDKNANRLQCVYWDDSSGRSPNWSPEGCSISEERPVGRVLCSCNHLTSFAVLKNVYQNPVTTSTKSPNSSDIGCGISLVCLILTVIINVCFKLTFV